MNFKKLTLGFLILSTTVIKTAYANEVKLTINKPAQIVYRLAYQDKNQNPVLGVAQTIQLNDTYIIPIHLDHHQAAGVVIESIEGHQLPSTANQFNQPQQCSMATTKIKKIGEMSLGIENKRITCSKKNEM